MKESFDFFKNLLFIHGEDKKIRLFFRLTLIEKYIESLSEIKIRILYDIKKSKNPFKIKFPNISHEDFSELNDEIWKFLEDLGKRGLNYKYIDVTSLVNECVKCHKRNLFSKRLF